MGGKSKAPPPPDYTPIANASKEAAEYSYKLGKEQLAWAKETYADDKAITDQVVGAALDQQRFNSENAAEDRQRYESIFQPLEGDLVADAKSYASEDRRALEVGRAQANVAQNFETARQNSLRNLESFGVDPSATRFAALDLGLRAQQAATAAAAGNQASQMVDATGRALRSEALNIGKGYPGQVAGTYNTALQAGNQAVGSSLATTASGANTMGTGLQWQGQGNQALGIWGNALTQGYSAQMQQWKANNDSSSGIGSALGLVGGIGMRMLMSDERVKENIEPVGKMNDGQVVYRYNYVGDPTVQIGLIAQDVEQAHPEAVAEDPRGLKAVDYGRATEEAAAAGVDRRGGGAIPDHMSPSRGQQVDDVKANLNAGEFVLPRDVVEWMGEEQLQKLVQKTRAARQSALGQEGAAVPSVKMQGARPMPDRALPVG